MTDPSELRIPDVLTFLAVCRHGSVTGAARDMRVTPSQVSKAVARLERQLKRTLLTRSARSVAASEEGRKLVPQLEELLERIFALTSASDVPPELKLTVAAPSYLSASVLPLIATAVPDARFRSLECGNAFMRAYAGESLFHVAVTIGPEKLPPTWASSRAGVVRRGLFGSPAVAKRLGPNPSAASLREVPFIVPVYNSGAQFLPSDDGCPIPREERAVGHEVATVAVGLELAAATGQLVFGPVFAARPLVSAGRLVEIEVRDWSRMTDDLYVHTNADRVLARVQRAIVDALRAANAEA